MSQGTDLRFIIPPDAAAERGWQLDVTMREGEPWFIGRHVCAILGIANARDALSRLDDDQKGVGTTDTLGGQQQVALINESGLYALIFTSRRPEAAAFRRWVTGDVLPTIRKTGSYNSRELTPREQALELARLVLSLDAQLGEALGVVKELQPDAEGYQELIDSTGNYSLAQAAQALGLGRQAFIGLLAEYGGLIVRPGHSDHLRPYQHHVQAGRFVVKVRVFEVVKDGVAEARSEGTTYVTPKGLDWFRSKRRSGGPLARSA